MNNYSLDLHINEEFLNIKENKKETMIIYDKNL